MTPAEKTSSSLQLLIDKMLSKGCGHPKKEPYFNQADKQMGEMCSTCHGVVWWYDACSYCHKHTQVVKGPGGRRYCSLECKQTDEKERRRERKTT